MKKILLLGCFLFLTWLAGALSPRAAFLAGDAPMPVIEDSRFTMKEPMAHRREILMASFNSFDVVGRPEQTGKTARANGGRRPSISSVSRPRTPTPAFPATTSPTPAWHSRTAMAEQKTQIIAS